jgi:putative peptidoglycan lipid II flippase
MQLLMAHAMRFQPFAVQDSVNKKIFRAATVVAVATIVVKIATTAKDLMVAHAFGRDDSLDAFLFAFILPAFALNLIVTAVSAALVPVLVETRHKEGDVAAQRLLSSVVILVGVALIVVAVVLALFAPLYLPYLAHSFAPEKRLLTRSFLYLLAPWLVLSGLATFLATALNAIEKFAIPALVPILTPLAVLLCIVLWTRPASGFALALGTVAGSLLEVLFLYYLAGKHHVLSSLRWRGFSAQVRMVLSQTVPMMAGALLMGATPVVDQVMAAFLGSGNVSALSYGNKIPAGLLAIGATALGTAALPYFSSMAATGDWQGCRHTLKRYSLLILSITIPCTVLLIVFSQFLVRMLFQRGAFTSLDTAIVSRVQACYAIQIPFYVLCILFVRFISSVRRNDLLMYASAINLIVDIGMNLVLMRIWGVAGIALSTSIVMIVSFTFLCSCSIRLLTRSPGIILKPVQAQIDR